MELKMRNRLICSLFLVVFHAYAADEVFVFREEYLSLLDRMERIVAPTGAPMLKEPSILILSKRVGITPTAMSDAIVQFAIQCDQRGNLTAAGEALGHLSRLGETNAVPYLESYITDSSHRGYRTQALCSLRKMAPDRFGCLMRRLVHGKGLTGEERTNVYRGIEDDCYVAAVLNGKEMADVREGRLLALLRDLAAWEEEDALRGTIDHILCDFLQDWKYSDDRVTMLHHWAQMRETQDERFNWSRIADETEEAIRTGKTEWKLLKDRPQPPSVPLNPDGSFKVTESPPQPSINDGEVPISPP